MRIRRVREAALLAAIAALMTGVPAGAQPGNGGFPDVPPWHWAYPGVLQDARAGLLIGYPAAPTVLVENSVTQVYDGFVHAQTPQAQAWVERFTFNRPSVWPGPLQRAQLTAFSIRDVRSAVTGETATASFVAATETQAGQSATTPMRVTLRLIEGDWKVDYATLAAGSSLFR
jgi:hypothetical protein